MEETGLHEVLSTVYAPNAASNMLQGKAVLRAVRGHILVDAALIMLLLSDIFRVPLPLPESDTEKNRDKNTQDEQTGTLSTPYESELNVNQVDALSINKDTAVQLHGVLELEAASMKELRNNLQLQTLAEVFLQDNATLEDILSAGEKALVLLYNGSSREGLDELRYRLFCSKVAVGTTFVQIHTLPPTSAAARFHSMRVYLQVQEWMGLKVAMDPTDYGWKLEHGILVPVTTDLPAAPADVLKVIRCTCKSGCDTKRCSCRKHGLECTSGCGECRGVGCCNSPLPSFEIESETS